MLWRLKLLAAIAALLFLAAIPVLCRLYLPPSWFLLRVTALLAVVLFGWYMTYSKQSDSWQKPTFVLLIFWGIYGLTAALPL